MPHKCLLAWLALIVGGLCCADPVSGATNTPLAQLHSAYGRKFSTSPVMVQGTVTFVDPARKLLVVQEGDAVAPLYSEVATADLKPGVRIELEGFLGPLVAAFPRFQQEPDGGAMRSRFEAPTNWSDCFLTRMSGVLHPPATGNYTFWIASDDSSELWLSRSENPRQATRIASVGSGRWTEPHQWNRHASQKSASIHLEAGSSYYLEAVAQDTGGADNLAVAWQGPGLTQSVIDGTFVTVPLQQGRPASAERGVQWEYWTNFFSGDLSVLRKYDRQLLRCDRAQILKREAVELPPPLRLGPGQPLGEAVSYRSVTIEGQLDFISQVDDGWVMVLKRGDVNVTVRLGAGVELDSVWPQGSWVRVSGMFDPGAALEPGRLTGTIWVRQRDGLEWLDTPENWALIKPASQRRLVGSNPELHAGQIIHAQGRVVSQEGPDLWRVEGKDTIRGFISSNGVDWVAAGPEMELTLSNEVLVGFAISSHSTGQVALAEFEDLRGLKADWRGVDIGHPPIPGIVQAGTDSLRVQGSGEDIWHEADQCFFAYQPVEGDAQISARLVELRGVDYGAKSVLMVRQNLSAESPWAGVVVMPSSRMGIQGREDFAEAAAGPLTVFSPRDVWVRVERRRNYFLVRPANGSLQVGQALDVLGQAGWLGQQLLLDTARTRELRAVSAAMPGPESGRTQLSGDIRDVRVADLDAEAKRALRVARQVNLRLRGVITFNAQVGEGWLSYVQDASGGVGIQWRSSTLVRAARVGDWVELTGTPGLTELGETFIAYGVAPLGAGEMPEPLPLQALDLRDAALDGQWTEVVGVGRPPAPDGRWLLMTRQGGVEVHVPGAPSVDPREWVNAVVRVRGVMRQSPRPMLLLPDARFLETVEAAPDDPFAIRTFSIRELQSIEGGLGMARMYKVRGTVTCGRLDFFCVQDETGGLLIESDAVPAVQAGDGIEVVGFPSRRGHGLVLVDPVVRAADQEFTPKPIVLAPEDILQVGNNGRLVSVEAVLLAEHRGGTLQTLELQSGQRAFQASLPNAAGQLPRLAVGSRVRLVGVAMADGLDFSASGSEIGGAPMVGSLEVLLRGPQDVLVIERPPWWNWKYTVATCGLAVMVFAGALVWIRTLRRRVEERTLELRKTMDRLQKETRISATLAERDRLAAEIHDSIEQGLSAIMMQMEAAAKLVEQPTEIKRYLTMAKNMANFSRTEVQHAVWDMQSPLLENSDLATALRRVARDISAGDMPKVNVEVTGAIFPLPSAVEHHLLRIAQEAMTNAVKHGNAHNIWLLLQYDPAAVALSVRDDGAGFDPDSVSTEVGHFGLQGMRIRATKMGGNLTVTSRPGEGTFIQLNVQLAENVASQGSEDHK